MAAVSSKYLINIADSFRFHKSVLVSTTKQFWKCAQQPFNSWPGHFHKLTRQYCCLSNQIPFPCLVHMEAASTTWVTNDYHFFQASFCHVKINEGKDCKYNWRSCSQSMLRSIKRNWKPQRSCWSGSLFRSNISIRRNLEFCYWLIAHSGTWLSRLIRAPCFTRSMPFKLPNRFHGVKSI